MSAVPASVGAPSLPQVNLLPPEVEGKRKRGRTRAAIVIGLLVFVLLLAALWFAAVAWRISAEVALQAEQDKRPALVAELAEYDYVTGVQDEFANAVLARQWAGITDVLWADYLDAVTSALPAGTDLQSLSVTQANAFGSASVGSSPFITSSVGTVSLTGHVNQASKVSDVQDAIEAISGLTNVSITVTSIDTYPETDTVVWVFDGTAQISVEALSGRTVAEGSQLLVEADASEEES